jgi:hypothetical protein
MRQRTVVSTFRSIDYARAIVAERRRLPVLQEPKRTTSEEDVPERPPWHWIGFGAIAIFAVWLPLAYVGGHVSRSSMTARFGSNASKEEVDLAVAAMSAGERARLMATIALPSILALALASFAGGVLVGRFGLGHGPRSAAAAGGVTALIASIMAWSGFTLQAVVGALVTFAVAMGFAAWGGRLGASRRPKT